MHFAESLCTGTESLARATCCYARATCRHARRQFTVLPTCQPLSLRIEQCPRTLSRLVAIFPIFFLTQLPPNMYAYPRNIHSFTKPPRFVMKQHCEPQPLPTEPVSNSPPPRLLDQLRVAARVAGHCEQTI